MGCICTKGISLEEKAEIKREKAANKLSSRFVAPSRRDDVVVLDADAAVGNDVSKVRLIPKPQENAITTPPLILEDGGKKKREPAHVAVDAPLLQKNGSGGPWRRATVDTGTSEVELNSRITPVPNGVEAEHIAAGWPSWLVSVAGDAIKGWVPRKADSFERLDKIGQGTYSNVYRARDLETGKLVALKKVRFVNMDPESVRFMAREIYVLRRLDHPNIVKLEALITSKMSCSLYLVFEYMEHDLAGLAASPAIKFSEPQVKCYMQQLLRGLDHCHSHGVLHRDIKGSNLLIDNNGILKIADFGLATFFSPDKSQPLTSRVVTLWYRPPELLLGATEYDVAVDLWSTGCILAELLAGKPIMPGRTEVEQLHKIFKLCGSPSEEYWRKSKLPHATIFKPQHPYRRCIQDAFKDLPSPALALLEVLLAIEPANRGTAASALDSEFFNTKPFACDPTSLPKYPPSKEFDAKLRDEETRRQKAAVIKGHGSESMKRGPREPRAVPVTSLEPEKRQAQPNQKCSSDKYNRLEDSASGFPIDPTNGTTQNGSLRRKKVRDSEHGAVPVRSLSIARASNGPGLKTQRSYMHHAGDMSNFSGLLTTAGSGRKNSQWPEHRSGYHQLDVAEASDKQEWTHHLLDRPASSHKKEERAVIKESPSAFNVKKSRIHYSGPLIPQGENLDEMLKEHERQIQQAVRKARVEKGNATRNYG